MLETKTSVEDLWDDIVALFSNKIGSRHAVKVMTTGLSPRLGHLRVRNLEKTESAQKLNELTRDLALEDLKYLYSRAIVNKDQAEAAARITIALNVSFVVGAIFFLNLISPNFLNIALENIIEGKAPFYLIFFTAVMALYMVFGIFHFARSFAATNTARDLENLLHMELAKRGHYPALS